MIRDEVLWSTVVYGGWSHLLAVDFENVARDVVVRHVVALVKDDEEEIEA